MNKMTLSALVVLVFFTIACQGQPKLKIECGDTYNWGVVKEKDSPLKAKIKIYNVGDQPLKIDNVKPGCGCTTAPLDKNLIAPNEFATLDVSLRVEGNIGAVSKVITITSNDSTQNPMVLHLKAEVTVPIVCQPSRFLGFGNMNKGKESTQSIILKNKTDVDIKFSQIELNPPGLKINLKEGDVLSANGQIQLDAKFTPDNAGPFSCTIKLKTSHPEMPNMVITGWGSVVAEKTEGQK